MVRKHLLILVASLLTIFNVAALTLPVKRINGKAYYYYTVGKKDRFYELPSKIGVKRADIVKYNPQAADGLLTGMVLTFPVEIDAQIVNGYYTITYQPESKESIYGIAKHFDVPVDRIIEFNPRANEGIHNLTLTIPLQKTRSAGDESGNVAKTSSTNDNVMPYIILKGETLTKIAKNHKVTVNEILAVNPDLNVKYYQAGQKIMIPIVPLSVSAAQPSTPQPEPVIEETTAAVTPLEMYRPIDDSDDTAEIITPDTIAEEPAEIVEPLNIAIMLPFMLSENEQSKATKLITEFYRGFLLGAESLGQSGDPVTIYAYDTAASIDTVASLLLRDEMKEMDIILAPGDADQLSMIGDFAAKNGSFVLNTFVVKDSTYLTNESMIQANIPHERMYEKAIDYFINQRYANFIPVFLSRVDGAADKIEFVTELKQKLEERNIPYHDIVYRNFLGQDNLENLNMTDSSYVFIPMSGARTEFNKFAPALKNFKNSIANQESTQLFGYPEWIMFRNEQLDMLQSLNSLIYSRFFGVADSPLAAKINEDYRNRFGLEMMDAAPNQGLLGYDTAVFVIKSLRNNEGDFRQSSMDYDGVQSGFILTSPDNCKGLVNDNLYFVDFLPGGITTKLQF